MKVIMRFIFVAQIKYQHMKCVLLSIKIVYLSALLDINW